MRCAEWNGTLIRYAGSASEASTGSQPIGSELKYGIYMLSPRCQVFPNGHAPSLTWCKRFGGHRDI